MSGLFIGLSFLFPRLTLFFCWLAAAIPMNDTPFVLDVLCAIFAPRLLIAYWMYALGLHPLFIILFAVFGLAEIFGGSKASSRSSDD